MKESPLKFSIVSWLALMLCLHVEGEMKTKTKVIWICCSQDKRLIYKKIEIFSSLNVSTNNHGLIANTLGVRQLANVRSG